MHPDQLYIVVQQYSEQLSGRNEISYFLGVIHKPVARDDADGCALVIPLRLLRQEARSAQLRRAGQYGLPGLFRVLLGRPEPKGAPSNSCAPVPGRQPQIPGPAETTVS
jgi:hypothetical protein